MADDVKPQEGGYRGSLIAMSAVALYFLVVAILVPIAD
jgi:hypothetical protein